MRNAERGASQIPFVISIVLLLVAAFLAYNQFGEREALEARLNKIVDSAKPAEAATPPADSDVIKLITLARGVYAKQKDQLEKVAEVTGGRNENDLDMVIDPAKLQATVTRVLEGLDKKDFIVEFPVDRYIESDDGRVKTQEGAGKYVIKYGSDRDLRTAKPDMTNVIEYVVLPAMTRMVSDIKRYRDAYISAMQAKEIAEAAYLKDLAAKDAEIRAKVEEASALEGRKGQENTDLRRQLGEAEAAKAAAEEDKAKTVAALTAELKAAKGEAEKRIAEVQVLKSKKRDIEQDTSPDGAVLSVSEKQDFVVVDVGRSTNNLQAGTNFDVYAIGKSGKELPKGVIKVTKTDSNSSSCAVLSLYDAFNPIVPGDKIRSITFSPKETVHVALVGRFQKMGKSDAARRLQSLGVVVDDKVTVNTTYLVVGEKESEAQPIEDTVEYKTAEIYGIPKISEKELSRFTMY